MPFVTELASHYGPTLDRYLETRGLELQTSTSHSSPQAGSPSREKIRQAILQLSEPEKVTYLTFEIILSLENMEACNNLDLLLSDSVAKASLPACFHLATLYCQDRLIFDHAYGFLCVKVIALLVQVALLSRSGYINRLVELITLSCTGQSIFSAFTTTTYSLMVGLMEDQLDSGPRARHELFGWDEGSTICLPEIGGCTAGQIQFLVSQLWNSRAGFLSCGYRGRDALFPGFSGFLCWMWRGIAQQHGLPGNRQNSVPVWTQLVDLSIRFTLYCSDREADIMSYVLLACPGSARGAHIVNRTNSAVDAQDRRRIATLAPMKIKTGRDLPTRFVTALFCFACPSVNYEENIFNIFGANIERLWFELDQIRNPEQLITKDIPYLCQGFLHVLSAMQGHNPGLFLRLLSSIGEDLYEGISRTFLLPLLSPREFKSRGSLDNLIVLLDSTSVCVRDMYARTPIEPPLKFSIRIYPIWNKVASQLSFLENFQNEHNKLIAEYVGSWHYAWSMTATWFQGRNPLGGVLHCAYSRCPTAVDVIGFECAGCHSKRYCSRRCQEADWLLPGNPHQSRCVTLPVRRSIC